MADVAQGAVCGHCGTFTACGGSFHDELLTGTCGLGHHVFTRNLSYVPAPTSALEPEPETPEIDEPHAEPEPEPKENAELLKPQAPKTFGRVTDGV